MDTDPNSSESKETETNVEDDDEDAAVFSQRGKADEEKRDENGGEKKKRKRSGGKDVVVVAEADEDACLLSQPAPETTTKTNRSSSKAASSEKENGTEKKNTDKDGLSSTGVHGKKSTAKDDDTDDEDDDEDSCLASQRPAETSIQHQERRQRGRHTSHTDAAARPWKPTAGKSNDTGQKQQSKPIGGKATAPENAPHKPVGSKRRDSSKLDPTPGSLTAKNQLPSAPKNLGSTWDRIEAENKLAQAREEASSTKKMYDELLKAKDAEMKKLEKKVATFEKETRDAAKTLDASKKQVKKMKQENLRIKSAYQSNVDELNKLEKICLIQSEKLQSLLFIEGNKDALDAYNSVLKLIGYVNKVNGDDDEEGNAN